MIINSRSYILISYDGAARANPSVIRDKEEAREIAERIHRN